MIIHIIISMIFVILAVVSTNAEYIDPRYNYAEEAYFYENEKCKEKVIEERFYKIKDGRKFYVMSTKKKKEIKQFRKEKGLSRGHQYEKIRILTNQRYSRD